MYDVVVIGAGVIGAMVSRELSRYQLSVCVLEKENDVACGASKANSGIVHGGYDPLPGTLKAQLNSEGVEMLFQAANELHVPIRRNGSMVCGFCAEDESVLEELYRRGIKNRIPGLHLLSGEEARVLEPNLSAQVTKVLHVTNAGIVCPYDLTISAMGNAMDNGVELRYNFRVNAISRKNNGFVIIAANGETVSAKYVINCAGSYSDRIAQMIGDSFFEVIPRAGEYMLLDKIEGQRVSHTLFQCPTKEGKGILVSPTVDGNLLVGPTASRVISPKAKDTTPDGMAIVERLAKKSVPSIQFRQVITSFTGVRASEKSGEFILTASKNAPGFIHAGAIDSPGLTCCVSIARYIVDLLVEQGAILIAKQSWDGTRKEMHAFRNLTDDEKNSFIKNHPSYGKVVCRCETVTEGEILDAIRTNPPARDIDGVKRRTRSGMGRCQGGFCGSYVMELIAHECNIPLEAVTKNGGDSRMLIGRIGGEND